MRKILTVTVLILLTFPLALSSPLNIPYEGMELKNILTEDLKCEINGNPKLKSALKDQLPNQAREITITSEIEKTKSGELRLSTNNVSVEINNSRIDKSSRRKVRALIRGIYESQQSQKGERIWDSFFLEPNPGEGEVFQIGGGTTELEKETFRELDNKLEDLPRKVEHNETEREVLSTNHSMVTDSWGNITVFKTDGEKSKQGYQQGQLESLKDKLPQVNWEVQASENFFYHQPSGLFVKYIGNTSVKGQIRNVEISCKTKRVDRLVDPNKNTLGNNITDLEAILEYNRLPYTDALNLSASKKTAEEGDKVDLHSYNREDRTVKAEFFLNNNSIGTYKETSISPDAGTHQLRIERRNLRNGTLENYRPSSIKIKIKENSIISNTVQGTENFLRKILPPLILEDPDYS